MAGRGRSSAGLSVVVTVATGLVVVGAGVVHRALALDGPPIGIALAIGLVAVVALVLVAGRAGGRAVGIAAVGAVVTVVGSGLGRLRGDEWLEGSGGGDVVRTSARSWPLVAIGVGLVLGAIVVAVLRRAELRPRSVAALTGLATHAAGSVLLALLLGRVVVGQWIEGRPRRWRGRLVGTPRGGSRRGGTAALWADAAREEAAAVGAFVDLAARLERVGAPARLVDRSRAAARDEVRHVGLCRRLAGGTDRPAGTLDRAPARSEAGSGHGSAFPASEPEQGPVAAVPRHDTDTAARSVPQNGRATRSRNARVASRRVELVRLAVESYVDGVVGEGMAAGRLERGAATAPDRADVLRSIARDERAHAALGADVVRWAVRRAPVLVPLAVRAAARRLPARGALPADHAAVPDVDLRAAGLVDRAGAAEVWAAERSAALAVLDDLLAPSAPSVRPRAPTASVPSR